MNRHIDLNTFERDDRFYGTLDLLVTIKSFDLQAIRMRYLASKKRNVSGKAGSVERRAIAEGGIAALTIADGDCVSSEVLNRMPEPRAIDARKGRFAFAAENTVHVYTDSRQYALTDPWFSYIHTVQFSPWADDRIVIASSGLDCIFEYNFITGERIYEWFAWENGFDQAHDPDTNKPLTLTRKEAVARKLESEGRPYLLVSDPERETLPTARRAAFINSVCYDPQDRNAFVATLFHEGAVFTIDRSTGDARKVLDGLKNPHGGRRYNSGFMGTSTASGELIIGDTSDKTTYGFGNLPGKPATLADFEWVQNTIPCEDLFISIDSNRNNLTVFQPERRLISQIPLNMNWAVQDIAVGQLTMAQLEMVRAL